jgi:hypothetical protein
LTPGKPAKRRAKAPEAPEAPAAPPPPEGLTQDEVAARVPCARSSVYRAIARRDIEPLPNGRLPESAVETMQAIRMEEELARGEKGTVEQRLLAAQASEREAKAKLSQLQLEREAGRYVELDLVQRDAADTAERILAVLRAVPQRTAMALECSCRSAAVVQQKISDEIERAIGELRESLFIQPMAE